MILHYYYLYQSKTCIVLFRQNFYFFLKDPGCLIPKYFARTLRSALEGLWLLAPGKHRLALGWLRPAGSSLEAARPDPASVGTSLSHSIVQIKAGVWIAALVLRMEEGRTKPFMRLSRLLTRSFFSELVTKSAYLFMCCLSVQELI